MTAKENFKGIEIPVECGRAEIYELTAILFSDKNSEEPIKKHLVYITKEDYENNKVFATIEANMNPEILLFPDDEHEGEGCLQYDLVETERIKYNSENVPVIIVEDVVNDSDTSWIRGEMASDTYCRPTPRVVAVVDNVISIEE